MSSAWLLFQVVSNCIKQAQPHHPRNDSNEQQQQATREAASSQESGTWMIQTLVAGGERLVYCEPQPPFGTKHGPATNRRRYVRTDNVEIIPAPSSLRPISLPHDQERVEQAARALAHAQTQQQQRLLHNHHHPHPHHNTTTSNKGVMMVHPKPPPQQPRGGTWHQLTLRVSPATFPSVLLTHACWNALVTKRRQPLKMVHSTWLMGPTTLAESYLYQPPPPSNTNTTATTTITTATTTITTTDNHHSTCGGTLVIGVWQPKCHVVPASTLQQALQLQVIQLRPMPTTFSPLGYQAVAACENEH